MITLTELAKTQILSQIEKNPETIGIKLLVRSTGCSGLVYKIELVTEENTNPLDTEILFGQLRND